MARTYRRRHVSDWESFVLSDHVVHRTPAGATWIQRVAIDPRTEEGRRRLARFHSDRRFHSGPPRYYRQVFHHRERQACRRALFVWGQRGDHDFLATPPHRHQARWQWF